MQALTRLIGKGIGLRIGMFFGRFVAALLAIVIIGSGGLIARITGMIVVMYRCTAALLHVLASQSQRRAGNQS
jgi:hypothetical protein